MSQEKVDRIVLMRKLDDKQKIVDELYEKEGLTDEVLDLQLQINEMRHQENIPDTSENLYKNFVQ